MKVIEEINITKLVATVVILISWVFGTLPIFLPFILLLMLINYKIKL